MLVRLEGWSDDDVLQLLTLVRKRLPYYIYGSDSQFAEIMRAELPGKAAIGILEMVRALMKQFELRLSTKNFKTDAHGQQVYVYIHLYESIRQLPENRAGGVWLPDELSRFLLKAKQYREQFTVSQEKYFQQVQLWGKSIAETKSKFYTLRELFIKEKRRSRQRTEMKLKRLELLKEIFTNVPPIHQELKIVAASSKAPRMWSSNEMETLVDFVVRITTQIQMTGCSELVDHVAETLHRTDKSCVNKLADMREKFISKAPTIRAANLPDVIFDPTSHAHKIFCADWTDINDPYALGYLALKSRSSRLYARYKNKRRNKKAWPPRPRHRIATTAARGAMSAKNTKSSSSSTAVVATATPSACEARNIKIQSLRYEKAPAKQIPAKKYASFVEELAEQCLWTNTMVLNVLQCMQHSIELYRSNNIVDFYSKVGSTLGVEFLDLFANAQHILSQFEQRYGSLDGFENLNLTATGIDSAKAANYQERKEPDHVSKSEEISPLSHVVSEQLVCTGSKSSKHGQDEQNGNSFNEAKKRCLREISFTEDWEDEDYDDEDDQSDEVSVNAESKSSDRMVNGVSHPLQSILDSLELHMVELQEKQRILIKQKLDRERHHQQSKHPYDNRMSVPSFSPER